MKDLGNNANNFNNERMNFPDKNQNIMKKDIKDKNFQQGNYINRVPKQNGNNIKRFP